MGKEMSVKQFITGAVLIILAVAFLGAIATQTLLSTDKLSTSQTFDLGTLNCYTGDSQVDQTQTACNLTVTNSPSGWKTSECPLTSVSVKNSSGTALTLDTDYYLVASTGTIAMLNTSDTNGTYIADNDTVVSYEYCGDSYLTESWSRSILNTNVGMYAIAILGIGIALVYYLMKKHN